MNKKKSRSNRVRMIRQRGFALVGALLLLLLISALAVGLLMMVNTETTAGGNDLQNNVAFHSAEGGLEKMTADLSSVFTNIQAPKKGDIEGVSALVPATAGITYPEYSVVVTAPVKADGVTIQPIWGTIKSGPNKDLSALLIPVTLSVTAQAKFENQVRMQRTAEIALIPVFQFGVFSDSDVSFFSSPTMDFAGRVHTNGDLYLGVSDSATLTFHDKLSAFGNVIRKRLPNGLVSSSYNNEGSVYIPTTSAGCLTSTGAVSFTTNCSKIGPYSGGSSNLTNQGSVLDAATPAGTGDPSHSNQNAVAFGAFVTGVNNMLVDSNYGDAINTYNKGAICLTMPFTGGGSKACATAPGQAPNYTGSLPYEIIRRPPSGEDTTTAVSQSRFANNAEIRVLLADDPTENHLDGTGVDSQDIRLANVTNPNGAPDYSSGVPVGSVGSVYFAEGTTDHSQFINEDSWATLPIADTGLKCYPSSSCTGGAPKISGTTWNLLDGYLRVEYRNSADTAWVPVTQEWLELGFARNFNNTAINPNAILILQQLADRNGNGTEDLGTSASDSTNPLTSRSTSCYLSCPYPASDCGGGTGTISNCAAGTVGTCTSGQKKNWTATCSVHTNATPGELVTDLGTGLKYAGTATRNNWYPINFYDPREGESRDNLTTPTAGSCATVGVMNAVELDVHNLQRWLAGTIGSSGASVPYIKDNGYILYFSDRRGMGTSPTAGYKTGDSGLEDVVNTSAGTGGIPDGVLETPGGKASPEDVNVNGVLDYYGAKNLGLGFGSTVNSTINANSSKPNPYIRIASCISTGRKNWVSGARHVLKLVDGTLGYLPTQPDGTGGFTVASENPVYIVGDYNANSTDPTWAAAHSAASIVADSVVLLSNSWKFGGNGGDLASFKNPFGNPGYTGSNSLRPVATSTYYRVAIASGKNKSFSFPSWGTSAIYGYGTDGGVHNFLRFMEEWSNATANYKGSMVSLYYSTYNTGLFKCCGDAVYHPPTRNYSFDALFTQPQNLPPGTPMFRDVNNLSYRQDFTPR